MTATRTSPRSTGAKIMDLVWGTICAVTLGAIVSSYVLAGNGITESLITGFGWFIIGVIVANFVTSIVSTIALYQRVASMTGTKVFWLTIGATLSIALDVVAFFIAINVERTQGLYVYLGTTLVADLIIDVITHMKRS
jgi:hypothetical protein